ncbi:hypothetical protein DRN63_05095 [Nanoarchaeota archaeon]|nr:MAG: hypothetical protein DRN63_05095 [Nanoarchaeota archaeon]
MYFIRDSIRDGFTLPLTYQAVTEGDVGVQGLRIRLTEDEIRGFIREYLDARSQGVDPVGLLDNLAAKTYRYINRIRTILMNPRRVDKIAEYVVNRLEVDLEAYKTAEGLVFPFKALVVAVNRIACVRYKRALEKYLVAKYGEEAKNWVEIVMTYGHNDPKEIDDYRVELIRRFGISDTREINKEIQRRFLEEENPKILVVTDMLLTGFDAPMLKVMYLDKPLFEHRLLQAIARVNRPFKDKNFGLIVDFIGLLEHVSKTMALYNLLAEEAEDIREDIKANLMTDLNSKFSEFESLFRDVKERLRSLRLRGEDASIDLDMLKQQLAKEDFDEEDFRRRIQIIATYLVPSHGTKLITSDVISKDIIDRLKRETLTVRRLINDMRRLTRLFWSIGAHPKRVLYVEDIQTLTFVYESILKYIRRGQITLGEDFWNKLNMLIYNRTIVDILKQIAETRLDVEVLDRLLVQETSKRNMQKLVIDYYFYLRTVLLRRPTDPLYKRILEHLEELRVRWLMRAIDLRTFLMELRELTKQKEEYDKRIQNKTPTDRIVESIRAYIAYEVVGDKDLKLELREFKEKLFKLLERKKLRIVKPSDKSELSAALLTDLLLELGERINPKSLKDIAYELVEEFVSEEIEKSVITK